MKRMNRVCWSVATAALLLTGVAVASTSISDDTRDIELSVGPIPVDSFNFFGRLDNWRALDRDTLIVWTTAFRPYLIELRRPSPELRFARVIGITSTVGRVRRGVDEIYVDGRPYGIESIYRLSPARARSGRSASAPVSSEIVRAEEE